MDDFGMTLATNECARINFWMGELYQQDIVSVCFWAENGNKISISVYVEGTEKHIIEISERGKKIITKKCNGAQPA